MCYSLRNAVRIIVSIGIISTAWWLFNKMGYVPPLSYFFRKEIAKVNLHSPFVELLNYEKPINKLVAYSIDKTQTQILIEKSQYRLTVYYQNQPIKSYPVVFGNNPTRDKLKEGDMKTPEGIFKVKDLYPHPQWSKFIWLDYPNHQSWEKHLKAKRSRIIPISASIGNAIGIHGVNQGSNYLINERNNWTWGCISLKNEDVDEIYSIIEVGTVIKIVP